MAEDLSDMQDAVETEGQADGDDALAALRAENAALKDQALRYAAEAENIRRRTEREANDARAYAIQKFARDLLDAADNLARALQFAPKDAADPAVSNFVMGVEMTEKALQTAFERNGLKRVDPARGARFDPNLHQAMMEQAADDVAPGCVIMVMQAGYELFGRIVRPALVAVTPKASVGASNDGAGYGGQDRETGASVDAKA
jgi:molecular chaperone GrpE